MREGTPSVLFPAGPWQSAVLVSALLALAVIAALWWLITRWLRPSLTMIEECTGRDVPANPPLPAARVWAAGPYTQPDGVNPGWLRSS